MSPLSHPNHSVQINPVWLDRARYIEFLNQAFPGQWDASAYDWYVARGFNNQPSDILVRTDGERVLSGMTLCYRQIAVDGATFQIAVLSAGATLAAERGQGHYAAMLQSALERCREKGCVAALGFVTRDNVSGHGLVRMGARAIPSFYIVSPKAPRGARTANTRQVEADCSGPPLRRNDLISTFESLARCGAPLSDAWGGQPAHFYYERADDWRRQFLRRPHVVRVLRLGHVSYAAIEAVHETDRLQLLVCPARKRARHIADLAAMSAAAGRKFFMYTLDPAEAAAARRARLQIRAGYLMLQPTGVERDQWHRLAGADWRVQSGDRM
jgi:hypothetical protein